MYTIKVFKFFLLIIIHNITLKKTQNSFRSNLLSNDTTQFYI